MKNEMYKGYTIRFKKFRGFSESMVLGEVNVFKNVLRVEGKNKAEVLKKLKKDIDTKIEDPEAVVKSMYD